MAKATIPKGSTVLQAQTALRDIVSSDTIATLCAKQSALELWHREVLGANGGEEGVDYHVEIIETANSVGVMVSV